MAGTALAIFRRGVFHFGSFEFRRGFFMAGGAQRSLFLTEQTLETSNMRLMAGGAITFNDWLMFRFRLFRNGIMAISAERCFRFGQHFRQVAPVGIVAGSALAAIDRLMLNFCFFEEIVVAGETHLLLPALHFD